MKSKQYINYTTEDFILDSEFMNWVLHPNMEKDRFWSEFLQKYPEKKEQVKEAVKYIKALLVVEPSVSMTALENIYQNIESSGKQKRISLWRLSKIAAIFLLLVSIGGLIYFLQDGEEALPFEAASSDQFEKGRVILPDGTVNEFNTEQTDIHQTASGALTINSDTVSLDNFKGTSQTTAMTQVIIPYGKHSEITLADGTKIWLNAGSQLSYPVNFSPHSRDVYLSGEAFFDVKSDPSKPFHVITNDMHIRVTGTRFNVTSYVSDQVTQAVLVSGKIDAKRNKRFARSVELLPGDRLIFDKENDSMEKDRVDVELYSSWINGYLVFDNVPVSEVFKKLERYYNQKIDAKAIAPGVTFSGKLDLADDLQKVLDNIGFSASFSVKYENEVFILKPLLPVK